MPYIYLDNQPSKKECNCSNGKQCIANGSRNVKDIIYRATVTNTTTDKINTYIDACSITFKARHSTHKHSFKNPNLKQQTTLSSLIWNMKDIGQEWMQRLVDGEVNSNR